MTDLIAHPWMQKYTATDEEVEVEMAKRT